MMAESLDDSGRPDVTPEVPKCSIFHEIPHVGFIQFGDRYRGTLINSYK